MHLESCDHETCTVIVARHAARDMALLALQYHEHTIYPSYTVKPFVVAWNNTRLNSPNSLAIDVKGNLFFSDAYFGLVESIDVFDRKLDEPPGANLTQSVYYIRASDLRLIQSGNVSNVEPVRLIDNLDRPSGVAVTIDNRLFVAQASPRKPCLTEYVIESHIHDGQEILMARDPVVLYEWTTSLHNWEQAFFSGVLGNIVLDEKNRLYVGVSDGVAVFDVSRRSTREVSPIAWIKAGVQPGPALVSYERGILYVAASSKVATVQVL
ncbi:Six-bladed beta-propeller TolB-like protein [Gracilaria domingensis]|nr:Six-bladed beta-propeller TolB-like protein [Gracilaria domingensis]